MYCTPQYSNDFYIFVLYARMVFISCFLCTIVFHWLFYFPLFSSDHIVRVLLTCKRFNLFLWSKWYFDPVCAHTLLYCIVLFNFHVFLLIHFNFIFFVFGLGSGQTHLLMTVFILLLDLDSPSLYAFFFFFFFLFLFSFYECLKI